MALLEQKNRIPAKVSYELTEFANCLGPTKSYIDEGKKRVQDVFSALQREPHLSVSRSYISGSVGKSTSVIYPDFDCVVFLNKKNPPLTDMVEEFEKIMREKAGPLQIVASSIKKSPITVSLQFTNGVEMDLLPACSFIQTKENTEDQYKEVLQRLTAITDPKLYMGYSSSLAETVLEFMRTQSGAVHQLVRIAKYWYKLCTIDGYIYGGSSIIEILCVDVAMDLDPLGGGPTFMVQAFRKFLQNVSKIDTLKIAFVYENKKFVRVPAKEFSLPKYQKHFDKKILARKNFIIEPANPYNDLARNIRPEALKRLKDFAKKMLIRLDKLESMQSNEIKTLSPDGKDIQLVHYDKLFEPFIMCLKDCYPTTVIPTYICVEYSYQNYNIPHENVEIRQHASDFFTKNQGAKNVYKTVKKNLLYLIRGKAQRTIKKQLSFTDGVTDIEKLEDVRGVVKQFIDANFGVSKFVKESSSNKDHQDYFVTISIPYRRMIRQQGCIHAVRFSMKWAT